MAYTKDLVASARRHQCSANELYQVSSAGAQPGCQAVAGYLFGLCGELAVKEMMRQSGMQPLSQANRSGDPFFAHFPELKTLLRDTVRGRRAGELRQIAENAKLFQYWDTDMRYAPTQEIESAWVDSWKVSADNLIDQMGNF